MVLLESIRIRNGKASLLPYHQQRVDRSRKALFGKGATLKLADVLAGVKLPESGLYKFRLEYGEGVIKHELIPYTPRVITSLRLVEADHVAYDKKYNDRSGIRSCLEKKGHCDDILMTQKGHLTDTSYANIALFDGRHWYTPAWPLLRGTRREELLDLGVIRPIVIRDRDLDNFQSLRLMNAMLPWEEAPTLSCEAIVR